MNNLEKIFTKRYWFRRNLKLFGFIKSTNKYIAYRRVEKKRILFEALHPFGKRPFLNLAEYNTAQIAHFAAMESNSPVVISLVPRHLADLNKSYKAKMTKMIYPINEILQKEAIKEYHAIIMDCLRANKEDNFLKQELLMISLHGMKNSPVTDVDLGTGGGKKCNYGLAVWIKEELEKNMKSYGIKINITIDKLFSNSWGNFTLKKKKYLGKNLKLLQIEMSQEMRINYPYQLALSLGKIADKFSKYEIERKELCFNNLEEMVFDVYQVEDYTDMKQPKIYLSYKQRKSFKTRVRETLVLKGLDGIEFSVHAAKRDKLSFNEIGMSQAVMEYKGISVGHKFCI